ncbi:hypothetical protein [Mucilaginibacter aquaedulcis]|uniref:hypothetical protein n=1 Tax=Mucilaginibacter aquaedulcis TaxID=1187081 RepID=UPI0025B5580B|nr:hypothetical protein [Mucilaginibacter aquaedulcis]MDN3547145.1 hypothetical protein [Mucilaginibacter aquaedulcis]
MKAFARQLFKTFLFAAIISIAANCIYYSITQKGADYDKALPKVIEGIVLLNIIVFVMSLPSLFLVNQVYWNNLPVRLILYFSGSIVFLITSLLLNLPPQSKVVYLLTGGIFLVVHAVFYYLWVKKRA